MSDSASRLARGMVAGISVVVGLVGLYGLYGVLVTVIARSPSDEPVVGHLSIAAFILAFAGFSGWCVAAAWRGWRPRTANAVRKVCTALAWMVAMCGLRAVDWLALPMAGLGQEAWKEIGNIVVLLTVVWGYYGGSRWLVRRLGLTEDWRPARSGAGPLLVWVIALMVFFASFRVFAELLGEQPGSTRVREIPDRWAIWGLLGPLILTVVTYRVGMRLLGWGPTRRRRVPGIDALPGGLAVPDEPLAPRRRGSL